MLHKSAQNRFHDQLAPLKQASLATILERLRRESFVRPVMAVEVEFYLKGAQAAYPQRVLALIDAALKREGISAHAAEQERGAGQFEVALQPTEDLAMLAEQVQELPQIIQAAVASENLTVDFSAKPLPHDFGSGLHWHIHLQNRRNENLFFRNELGTYSTELLWAVGGLLEMLPESLLFFAPHAEDYTRFQQPKMNAPTTISWGPNNRSAALRLPNKPLDSKHIEHRVAGTNADPWLCILAILAGVAHGLEHKVYPQEAVHGEASDPQYDLEPLPDYREALSLFQQSKAMSEYLGGELCGEFLRRAVYPDGF